MYIYIDLFLFFVLTNSFRCDIHFRGASANATATFGQQPAVDPTWNTFDVTVNSNFDTWHQQSFSALLDVICGL